MEDHEEPNQTAPEAEEHKSQGGGVLTNTARTVGSVIGKVSSTLGLVHAQALKPEPADTEPDRPERQAPARKRSLAKKASVKKGAGKRPNPPVKKAAAKKAGPRAAKKRR